MKKFLLCIAVFVCLGAVSLPATVITFTDLTGNNGDAFTGTTSGGYSVSVLNGNWYEAHSFGDPVPSIYTQVANGIAGTIAVTGGTFTFDSVGLAANNGDAAFTFTGLLGGSTMFSNSGTVPGHFGPFAFETVLNASAPVVIDTLYIHVGAGTRPSSINLDNIVVNAGTPPPSDEAAVPEPGTVALMGMGLVVLAIRALRK